MSLFPASEAVEQMLALKLLVYDSQKNVVCISRCFIQKNNIFQRPIQSPYNNRRQVSANELLGWEGG
jgi:hypothetical protein